MDNMLHLNRRRRGDGALMLGGLPPGVDGGLLNARLRYFDPERRRRGTAGRGRIGLEMTDTRTVGHPVNLNKTQPRTVIVQGGAYGEHQLESVTIADKTTKILGPSLRFR